MNKQQMIEEIYEIIGYSKKSIPDSNYESISLARVLSALDKGNGFPNQSGYVYFQGEIYHQDLYDDGDRWDYSMDRNHICSRKLLNKNGSDAYLDDQSEQTIEALHKLLVR